MKYLFIRNLQILKVSEKCNFTRSLVRIGNKQQNPPWLSFPFPGCTARGFWVCAPTTCGPGASAFLYC